MRGRYLYAYLHGFLSGPSSSKGRTLQRVFQTAHGLDLQLLDLNGPNGDPSDLTHEGALAAVDACWQAAAARNSRLRLIGSSFGGWVAAAYAERYPERVDRLLLLSPALAWQEDQWERIVGGTPELDAWRESGTRSFAMPSDGRAVTVPWRFARDTLSQSRLRSIRCPTCIVHGQYDREVPPAVSRAFFLAHAARTRLVLPGDDHAVAAPDTLTRIASLAAATFELPHSASFTHSVSGAAEGVWEAERKVRLRDAAEARLVEDALAGAGATFREEEGFVDEYWDLPDAALAKRGAWLRRRAGLWELKLANGDHDGADDAQGGVDGDGDETDSLSDVHMELEGAAAVTRWLVRESWLPAAPAGGDEHAHVDGNALNSLLRASGLAPYAAFGTTRRRYRWEGLSIDIDVAWHIGQASADAEDDNAIPMDEDEPPAFHRVLEVEALGDSRADATSQLHVKLGRLMAQIGRASEADVSSPEGKLEFFVTSFREGSEHDRLFRAYRRAPGKAGGVEN